MHANWKRFVRIVALLLGSVALLALATGCSPTATPAAPTPLATTTPGVDSTPAPYTRVEVSTVGISFEVPADWTRLDPAWDWSPAAGSPVILGFRWADVDPPAEVEAVMLPRPAVVQGAEPLDTSWGNGRRYTVAVYDPDEQGLVRSVQDHAIIVVTQNGTRRAYDLYASAPSEAELAAIRPLLLHMVESSTAQP